MRVSSCGAAVVVATLLTCLLAGFACNQAADKKVAGGAVVEQKNPAAPQPAEETAAKETKLPEKVLRFGMVTELKKDKADRYNDLHANPWPEINAMIKKCNIRSYSIYECEIQGKLYLFSYFEYVGDDFEKDTKIMAADPKTKEWWAETDPCQIPLPGTPKGKQWMQIREVYHLD